MAQTMLVVSLCLILIANVLAEEQFQTTGGNNIEENGSSKPPENIDKKVVEERVSIFVHCWNLISNLGAAFHPATVQVPEQHLNVVPIIRRETETKKVLIKPDEVPGCTHLLLKDPFRLASPINLDSTKLITKEAKLPIVPLEKLLVSTFVVHKEKSTNRLEFIYPKTKESPQEKYGTTPKYDLITMRVHVPSRHTLNRKRFKAEIEFIYRDNPDPVLSVAKMYAVSVFVQIGNALEIMDTFMNGIKAIHNGPKERMELDIQKIHSKKEIQGGIWYEGTYMTPPCYQKITHYFSRNVQSITEEQAQVWKKYGVAEKLDYPPTDDKGLVYKDA